MELDEILKLIKQLDITGYQISQETELTQVGADKIINGTSKKPQKKTLELLSNYLNKKLNNSYVNKKDDLKNINDISYVDSAIYIDNYNTMFVPLINQYAYGSYLNGYSDPEYIDDLPKVPFESDREHKGDYLCFEVKGDSMDDDSKESYVEGDILLCRNVRQEYWKSKLHIHKWDFVIVHKEKGIVVKRITHHDVEKGIITLHSLNDFYEDYDVHLSDVSQIFNIVDFKRKPRRR